MKNTAIVFSGFLVLLVLVGSGCSLRPQTANQTYSDAEITAAAERFGEANIEILGLMQEAAQQGVDVSIYVSRQSQATYVSSTNMVEAADQMEAIAADLRAELGR